MAAVKRCSTCHVTLPLTEFNRRTSAPDGLQARCRDCCRDWYQQHRTTHIANVLRRNRAYRRTLWTLMAQYMAEHPCVDCGERDVRCLEFDHRDRKAKTAAISQLIGHARSWSMILREIEKCEVRCANCHRRKTAAEDNSWRQRVFLAGFAADPVHGISEEDSAWQQSG